VPAYLVGSARELKTEWLAGVQRVGITAGASAPEELVQGLLAAVEGYGASAVRKLPGVEEHVKFPMPKGLN